MSIRELINQLLDYDADTEIYIEIGAKTEQLTEIEYDTDETIILKSE